MFDIIKFGDSKFDSLDEFISYFLNQNLCAKLFNINIIATISIFDSFDDFVSSLKDSGFQIISRKGNFLLISKQRDDTQIQFQVLFDTKNKVPLFFTDAKKTEEIPDTLFNYINKSRKISNLWIPPSLMKEIKDELILENDDLKITYFSARRTKITDSNSYFRPHIERGIQYRGDDGKQTLEEMEYSYGVLPKILDISIHDQMSFRIDNKGIITFKSGNIEKILNIINKIIHKTIQVRDVIKSSDYFSQEVGTTKKFTTNIQKPWNVFFSEKIDSAEVLNFCRSLKSDEWNFVILEKITFNEAVYFSARIIDSQTGSLFDVTLDESKIDIYPVKEPDVSSSMKFFQFILESVDQFATVA